MIIEDKEIINLYVEESLEHLSDIETDLLAIEEIGVKTDDKIINQVFRAAHSIKGGAGYMGFSNVKELSHYIENVLDRIRKQDIQPDATIISILLKSFDKLKELINNIEQSNEIDIRKRLDALSAYSTVELSDEHTNTPAKVVDISLPGGKKVFTIAHFDIALAQKEGKNLYVVEYILSMKEGNVQVSKTLRNDIPMLLQTGYIIDSSVDFTSIGTLEEELPDKVPVWLLYASIIDPDIGKTMFAVDEKNVHFITSNQISRPYYEGEIDPNTTGLPTVFSPTAHQDKNAPSQPEQSPAPARDIEIADLKPTSAPQTSLRVNLELLDKLMNLAGELVLCRNQLIQASTDNNNMAQENAQQRIDTVTSELQEAIMQTRMQSIANVFNKFPRLVRDLSADLGKKIGLSIERKNVELDKTIIEAISDPLTHIVRNAVDHGIELPNVRKDLGKAPSGKLKLSAYHEAGHVNIEISDDGKGLDGKKLADNALKKGLVNQQQIRSMSEREKIALVFLPGFSTAEKVTEVSGRGVGMDVVKTNLDKIGGIVEIDSERGVGSMIRIKIPLTLAIIPSQIIYAGNERYAIPQVNLDELLIVSADQTKKRIEKVGDAEVVRLRGSLLPLLDLAETLGINRTYLDPEDKMEYPDRRRNIADRRSKKIPLPHTGEDKTTDHLFHDTSSDRVLNKERKQEEYENRQKKDRRFHAASDLYIAVVSAGDFKYGVVVGRLCDSEEIVVRPIGRHLKNCKGYAGATIMGDGKVALILDIVGLAHMGKIDITEVTDRITDISKHATIEEEELKDSVALLIFNNAESELFAAPMSLVERIESIDTAYIAYVGEEKVIKYRGGLLPLFSIDEIAKVKTPPERDRLEVIVFMVAGKTIGLIATPPVDGVEVTVDVDSYTLRQPGIMGSALINNQVTLMVDIFEAVKTLKPKWYEGIKHKQDTVEKKATILFAEDSTFFRNQVKGYIEDDGYTVIEASDGLAAWDALNKHSKKISAVVTDLDMPKMSGFDLSEKIKRTKKFSHLPIIALTSLATDADIVQAKAAGMDDYQLKLDRKKLLESLSTFTTK